MALAVPDGELIHDDFILADSLTAKLDQLDWHFNSRASSPPSRNYFKGREHNFLTTSLLQIHSSISGEPA